MNTNSIIKSALSLMFIAVVLILGSNGWFQTNAGYTYVYQNNLTGELSCYSEPGVHFRIPFLSKVTEYKQVLTINFGENIKDNSRNQPNYFTQQSSKQKGGISVRFADTYTGLIPATFRFKLSTNSEKFIQMHKEFRTFDNLVDAMLVKNARNVTVITATQYTGEEFFQGGLNQFKSKLEDQLRNGVYVTERKQVEVEQMDLAPVGLDQADSNKLQNTKQLVWKTIPLVDSNGLEMRQRNTLDQYGIEVTQVTVGDPLPESQLDKLLSDKKQLVAERIKTIQEQETAKAQAKTEQLKKEIERTRAVQDAQRYKELAVIEQQQEVEVAEQIALKEIVEQNKLKDLAVIQKQKDLDVANAEKGIQKANAEAALFAAESIRARGIAEADVLKARYEAYGENKDLYVAEINRDIAQSLYTNLKDFKIELPRNLITGQRDGQGLTSNLDIISAFGALDIMDKVKKQVDKNNASN